MLLWSTSCWQPKGLLIHMRFGCCVRHAGDEAQWGVDFHVGACPKTGQGRGAARLYHPLHHPVLWVRKWASVCGSRAEGTSCGKKIFCYNTVQACIWGKKIKNRQTNITTDFESQSSGVNDNSSSLGSDCCYSNFFLFFSIYAPYARWYEVKYCIYARSRPTYWGLIIAGGWRKCSDSRTGAEDRKAQVVLSN